MRLALPAIALLGSVCLVVGCVGGPGSIEQGGENGDQYGGVRADTSGSRVASSSNSQSSSGEDTPTPTTKAPKDIKASDYDQSCTKDSDCAAIYEGSACACPCPNAAIAQKDAVEYATEVATARVACAGSSTSSGVAACTACTTQQARCQSNKCTL